jgi:hypothetical protein
MAVYGIPESRMPDAVIRAVSPIGRDGAGRLRLGTRPFGVADFSISVAKL